jgi:uncharacterized protein with HEPN domain
MPPDRDPVRLQDMLLWSRKAIAMLGQRSYESLMADEEKKLALVRCIEVIGEAGHKVSAEVQDRIPGIPWHAMWAMRNRLIHDYGNTNYRVVYDVVSRDLPLLVAALEAFIGERGYAD